MAWIRSGDTSATYPKLMRVRSLPTADERSVNEVMGFVARLAFQSGAHLTDYVVDAGTVDLMGGSRAELLVKQCKRVGLLTEVKIDGLKHYKIHEDPDFIHLRLKAEIEWSAQQQKDCRNRKIAGPVRARDGDLCRYCGVMVMWRGRPSANSATLDHVAPGQPATVDTMVVACRGCNGGLRDIEMQEREELKPAPITPYYSEHTAAVLTDWGIRTAPTERPDHQPGAAKATRRKINNGQRPATADTATTRQRPGTTPDTAPEQRPATADTALTEQRPGSQPDTALTGNAHSGALTETFGTDSDGSGRVGSGSSPRSAVSTRNPAGTGRRRSRRGKRA